MNEITFTVLKIILSVASALITVYLVPLLKKWKENEKNKDLVQMIEVAVRAAEQTLKGEGQGAAKKQKVLNFIYNWLEKKGIKITEEQLDQLIEAAVYNMNGEGILFTKELDVSL